LLKVVFQVYQVSVAIARVAGVCILTHTHTSIQRATNGSKQQKGLQ